MTEEYTLTLIDTRRVQGYLFNANELRQNLGASLLVEQATHEWLIESLPPKNNIEWDEEKYKPKYKQKTIEGDHLEAEVIFMGGGNVAILFVSHEIAKTFSEKYTRRVMCDAPGLDVAIGHTPVDWGAKNGLKAAWEKMQKEVMPASKDGRAVSQILSGLGVTAECMYTGLPAVDEMRKVPDRDDMKVLVSAEARAKRDQLTITAAQKRLNTLLPPTESFDYPNELEKLGGELGRSRYIAVVHADGNAMGKRITAFLDKFSDNRERVNQLRNFSNALNQAGMDGLEVVLDWLRNTIRLDKDTGEYLLEDQWGADSIRYQEDEQGKVYLPIRPIVFGGDDITFVSEGRLGIALAVKLLEAFHASGKLPDGKPVFACAGIAIVHQNYPFARAYQLAASLTNEAKKKAQKYDREKRASLIYWHISTTGLTLDWEDIRQWEYQVEAGDLLLRPLVVNKADDVTESETSWRTWNVLEKQIIAFRQSDEWSARGNKRKELREILRQGPEVVRKFTEAHGKLPAVITGQEEYQDTGWYGKRCIYFDALDAEDWLILPKDKNDMQKEEGPNA